MNMDKFVTSSADPSKVSMSIKGILIGLLPLAISITGMTELELMPIIDGIVELIFLVTSLLSVGFTTFGLIRKIYYKRWSAT